MSNKTRTMLVQDIQISVSSVGDEDFISLTDMAKGFSEDDVLVKSWLRSKQTVDFLGAWEKINNPNFNWVEFDLIRMDAGSNAFTLSAKKWVESVDAIGLKAKAGRYGGTYAHKDIAFEFGSWLSPEFKLYLIKEFQRLKDLESQQTSVEWQVKRELAKVNYRVHTDAIQEHVIPTLSGKAKAFAYANEADMFNDIVYGQKAAQWKKANPNLSSGNQRDYGTALDCALIANLESYNAILAEQKLPIEKRAEMLKEVARKFRASMQDSPAMQRLNEQTSSNNLLGQDKPNQD